MSLAKRHVLLFNICFVLFFFCCCFCLCNSCSVLLIYVSGFYNRFYECFFLQRTFAMIQHSIHRKGSIHLSPGRPSCNVRSVRSFTHLSPPFGRPHLNI
uniref:Uncharacterized protein n=1 Tax=Anopheles darlingi TaxID=43151 RepID=A0A2M4D5X1_ANODA